MNADRSSRVPNNDMSIVGIGVQWQRAVKGPVLLVAVVFDVCDERCSRV